MNTIKAVEINKLTIKRHNAQLTRLRKWLGRCCHYFIQLRPFLCNDFSVYLLNDHCIWCERMREVTLHFLSGRGFKTSKRIFRQIVTYISPTERGYSIWPVECKLFDELSNGRTCFTIF